MFKIGEACAAVGGTDTHTLHWVSPWYFLQATSSSAETAFCFDGYYNVSAPGDCIIANVTKTAFDVNIRGYDADIYSSFISNVTTIMSNLTCYVEARMIISTPEDVSVALYDVQKSWFKNWFKFWWLCYSLKVQFRFGGFFPEAALHSTKTVKRAVVSMKEETKKETVFIMILLLSYFVKVVWLTVKIFFVARTQLNCFVITLFRWLMLLSLEKKKTHSHLTVIHRVKNTWTQADADTQVGQSTEVTSVLLAPDLFYLCCLALEWKAIYDLLICSQPSLPGVLYGRSTQMPVDEETCHSENCDSFAVIESSPLCQPVERCLGNGR